MEKYRKSNKNKRHIVLNISETALRKIIALIESFDGEVGWHGTTKRTDKTTFGIEDVFVYPQMASEAFIDTEQFEYEKWLMTCNNEIFNNLRMHGHSHVNFSVNPSSTDDKHRTGIVNQLNGDKFYIFMIWNKKYDFHTLIYDHETCSIYDNDQIDLYAVLNGTRQLFKGMDKNKLKNLPACVEIETFINDSRNIVRTEQKEVSSYNVIENKELYDLLKNYVGYDIHIEFKPDHLTEENANLIKLINRKDNTEIMAITDEETSVNLVWSVDDVKYMRPDLTDDECMGVLEHVKDKHDATIGVSWDTLEITADILFGTPEKPIMLGKFIKNSFNSLLNKEGSLKPHKVEFLLKQPYDHDILFVVEFLQLIEKKRLYHHWYGGDVCNITLTMNGMVVSAHIKANGDIRAWLTDKDGSELCNIKDRTNRAGFYELSRYIPDDVLLSELLLENENEQGLSLTVDDHNWWEMIFDDESGESIDLDSYLFPEALAEAVANMYKTLERRGNASESE